LFRPKEITLGDLFCVEQNNDSQEDSNALNQLDLYVFKVGLSFVQHNRKQKPGREKEK